MARSKWTRTSEGGLWLPEPNRRAVLAGASASAAALLLGCGDSKPGAGPGPSVGVPGTGGKPAGGSGGVPGGSGGGPAGTGGNGMSSGSGGAGTGGSGPAGTGGSASDAGAPGTGGAAGGSDAGMTASDTGGASDTNVTPTPGGPYSCTVRPQQTEGPYFRDYKLNRKDIRSDPAAGNAVKPGIPLRVVFKVGQISGQACSAFANVMVDLWQCDAAGVYSGYSEEGTAGKQYLRGFQATDSTGTAEFMSIYPGPYSGRAVHVHFKLRTNPGGTGRAFTSQLYFPEMINDEVFAQAPYSGRNRLRNTSDGIFRDGGSNLIPKMTKEPGGWLAEFDIGLRMA